MLEQLTFAVDDPCDLAPGRYRSITRLSFSESVAPQAFPEDVQVWLE